MKRFHPAVRSLVGLIAPIFFLPACGSGGGNGEDSWPKHECNEGPPSNQNPGFIHGSVLRVGDEAPIDGAVVRLEGETGCVATEASGEFTIPVPDGGAYHLVVRATGFTHARRTGAVPAGRDRAVDTVYLTGLDRAVTEIGPGGGEHRSAAGGLVLTFPEGALDKNIQVRATRYDQGRGLPAALPKTSHFTMALRVDAEEADLDKPVRLAFPNDYGFPPGTPVPVGFFDEASATWVPDGMGVVSDDGSQVLYEAEHFSACDVNLPAQQVGLPSASGDNGGFHGTNRRRKRDPCKRNGSGGKSLVDLRTGNLRHDVEIPLGQAFGLPETLRLVYQSTAAKPGGWVGGTRADVPADFDEPPEYAGIEVEVEGVREMVHVALDDDDNYAAYLWNGRNARGEQLPTGLYDGWLRIFYGLPAQYATADYFGGPPVNPLGVYADEPVEADATSFAKLAVINHVESPVAPGWSVGGVSRLHFHPDGTVLIEQDGESRGVFPPAGRLERIGGSEDATWDCSDGDPATNDCFDQPKAVAAAPDGSVIVGDAGTHLIRRIRPDGTLGTVYDGSGEWFEPLALAVADDGTVYVADSQAGSVFRVAGGALQEVVGNEVMNPSGLAFAPDGTLYIADNGLALFRLPPGGSPERVGDIMDADRPLPSSLAVAPDGSVLLAEPGRQQIRRLLPDGSVRVVAGVNMIEGGYGGDDGWAQEARLNNPAAVAVGPDGTVYVADEYNSRVRAVDERGIIRTVAGVGYLIDRGRGEGGPATDGLVLRPSALSMDSDGRLIVATPMDAMIFRVDFGANLYDRPASSNDRLSYIETSDTYELSRLAGIEERYDAKGRLTGRTDEHGRTTTFSYDAEGRVTGISNALWEETVLAYDGGGISAVTDPSGRTTQFTLDPNRNLATVSRPDGGELMLQYADDHLLTGWEDADGRTASYRFDDHDRISEVEGGEGDVRRYAPLESQGLINDVLAAGRGGSASTAAPAITTPMVEFEDGSGRTMQIRYDALGEATSVILPDGEEISMDNGECGLPIAMTDADGMTVYRDYDEWGRVLKEQIGFGFRTYEYAGDLLSSWTDRDGRIIVYGWDNDGNLEEIRVPGWGGGPVYTFEHNPDGQIAAIQDATGVRYELGYDARGNLLEVSHPLGLWERLTRDARGNIDTIEDGAGSVTRFIRDESDRVIEVTDAAMNLHTVHRDGQGLITGVTSGGKVTTFGRDAEGRLDSASLMGAPVWTIGYDGEGRVQTVHNPAGGSLEFGYDGRGRPVSKVITWNEGSEAATFAYGPDDQIASMSDDDSEVTFGFDIAGRPTEVTQFHDGMAAPVTIGYTLSDEDLVQSVHLPALDGFSGGEFTYSYDGFFDLVTSIYAPSGRSFDLVRDDAGRLLNYQVNWGDDWDTVYTYDTAGRPTGVTAYEDWWQAVTLFSAAHTLGNDGTRLDETNLDGSVSYGYDALGRLTGATYTDGRPAEGYAYDETGDPTGPGYVYDEYHRMSQGRGITYEYDDAGRVVRRTRDADGSRLELSWDGDDKLVGVDVYGPGDVTPAHVLAYRYDADGKRIARVLDGVTTFYIYDAEDVVLELDETGRALTFYLHGPQVDQPLNMVRGGQSFVFITDLQGTVRALARRSDKVLVLERKYSALGEILQETGTAEVLYGFQGRPHDPLTGLVHFRTREYDPVTGRFLSTDPLRFSSLINPYAFPGSDPVNRIDPLGMGPPKAATAVESAFQTYDDAKAAAGKGIGWVAQKVGGRGAKVAAETAWKHGGSQAVDHYTRVPGGPLVTMGRTAIQIWSASKGCDKKAAGGRIGKSILTSNLFVHKKFGKMIDSVNTMGGMVKRGR